MSPVSPPFESLCVRAVRPATTASWAHRTLPAASHVQVDAWQVCHELLNGPDSPMEARLFASQTFRTKVIMARLSQILRLTPADSLRPQRHTSASAVPTARLAHIGSACSRCTLGAFGVTCSTDPNMYRLGRLWAPGRGLAESGRRHDRTLREGCWDCQSAVRVPQELDRGGNEPVRAASCKSFPESEGKRLSDVIGGPRKGRRICGASCWSFGHVSTGAW